MASQRRFKVLENYREPAGFHPRRRDQFQPPSGAVYQKLRPDVIFDLLDRSISNRNPAQKPNVLPPRRLLERMSDEPWTCTATAHEGGMGGGRGADPYLHFNIWFERAGGQAQHYHVRCHERDQGGLYVFQVTF
jgi:hypothetical protein